MSETWVKVPSHVAVYKREASTLHQICGWDWSCFIKKYGYMRDVHCVLYFVQ